MQINQEDLECEEMNENDDNSITSGISLVKELEDKWSKIKPNDNCDNNNHKMRKLNKNEGLNKMKGIFNILRGVNETREKRWKMKNEINEFDTFIKEKKKELDSKFNYNNNMFNINDFKVNRKSVSVNSNKPSLSFNQNRLLESTKKLNRSLIDNNPMLNNTKVMECIKQTQQLINDFGKKTYNSNSNGGNNGNLFSKYHHRIIMPSSTIYSRNYNTNPKSKKIQYIYHDLFK